MKDFSLSVDLSGQRINAGDEYELIIGPRVSLPVFYGIESGKEVRTADGTVIGRIVVEQKTPESERWSNKKKEAITAGGETWRQFQTESAMQEVSWKVVFNEAASRMDSVRFAVNSSRVATFDNPSTQDQNVSFYVKKSNSTPLLEKSTVLKSKTPYPEMESTVWFDATRGIKTNAGVSVTNRVYEQNTLKPGNRIRYTYNGNGVFKPSPEWYNEAKTRIGQRIVIDNQRVLDETTSTNAEGLLGPTKNLSATFVLESVSPEGVVVYRVESVSGDDLRGFLMNEENKLGMGAGDTKRMRFVKVDGTPLVNEDADLYEANGHLKKATVTVEVFAANDNTMTGPTIDKDTRPVGYSVSGSSLSATGETAKQRITVRFVDSKTGQELKTQKEYLPLRGNPFSVPESASTIEGKTLINPNDATIERVNDDATITLRYEDTIKNSNVSVLVVDEAGKTIRPTKTVFAEAKPEGTQYSVRKPRIAGYRFVRAEGELAGTLGKTDKTVKLVYKVDPSVVAGTDPDTIEERKESVVPIPFETETRDNPELWQGEERVINPGAEGSKTVITTRQLDENQQPVGDPVVTENVTKQPVKRVIERGTKNPAGTETVTTEKPKPFKTETRDNPDLYEGDERVVTEGKDGVTTVTTVYKTNKGKRTGDNPTVTETEKQPPVNRVIERGAKDPNGTETVTTEKPKPFKTETRDNPELYEGDERVVTEGKDGVTTITTVYKTNKGKRTGDNPTVTETEKQPPVNRVVERGTKDPNGIDTVKEHEDVVYKTEYRDNPELYEGETRVIQDGELGANVITKQYKTKKGKRTDEEPVLTKTTEKEPKNRIIERGTKPVAGVDTVVEDKEVPFKLVVKDNPELTEGEERVVTEGTPGLVKKKTAYKTEKGKRVGDPTVTETVVKEPIDRVVEKGTKPKTPKQTDADKNNPKGKDQTVFVGDKPDPKNSVENYNDLPEGTVVKWEKAPDTATPGQKPSILLFEYPDGSIERVSVIVTAIPKPEPKDQTVFVGDTPKAEDSIGNYPQLPEGTRVSWLVPPKTDKPGVVDGVVLIEYPDGRRVEVPVKVTVVEKEKEKQTPQQEQNNNGENGNNKDKVSEDSDNSDNSDKDSNKDKPTPQGKDQTVKVGDNPLVQNSIVNHKDLPKGTKLSWEKTPDTTKPGVIEAVVLVEYPDGTSERIIVRITVVDDSDKGKEKDNRENDNKTKTDTNSDNNKTPDKKELNQNKQPDRKESIKTGVGLVDQTAAGVALTATALALSAFALRRRKQQ